MHSSTTSIARVLLEIEESANHDWISVGHIVGLLEDELGDCEDKPDRLKASLLKIIETMLGTTRYSVVVMDEYAPGGVRMLAESTNETLNKICSVIEERGLAQAHYVRMFDRVKA